jgi:hypothetical protein
MGEFMSDVIDAKDIIAKYETFLQTTYPATTNIKYSSHKAAQHMSRHCDISTHRLYKIILESVIKDLNYDGTSLRLGKRKLL